VIFWRKRADVFVEGGVYAQDYSISYSASFSRGLRRAERTARGGRAVLIHILAAGFIIAGVVLQVVIITGIFFFGVFAIHPPAGNRG
jgi:hypothetical protein